MLLLATNSICSTRAFSYARKKIYKVASFRVRLRAPPPTDTYSHRREREKNERGRELRRMDGSNGGGSIKSEWGEEEKKVRERRRRSVGSREF
jgi:hypothetical protein